MDHRIAANWTRDGIRSLQENALNSEIALAQFVLSYYRSLHGKQKLSHSKVTGIARSFCEQMASHKHNIFLDRFDNAKISKHSGRFDALFLGSSFEPPESPPSRDHESLLQVRLFQGRFRRKQFSMNNLQVSVFLRSHAIQRYIERTDNSFEEAIKETEPTILFVMGLPLTGIGGGFAVPFMAPARNGAFFGVQIPGKPMLAEVSSITIDAHDLHQKERSGPSLTHLTETYINTFVGVDELREEQLALCDRLRELIDRHREMLLHYAMKEVAEADDFIFSGTPGERMEAIAQEINLITSGNLWQAIVTPPTQSIFHEHFDEQKRLDRYGLDVLLAAEGIDLNDGQAVRNLLAGSEVELPVIEALLQKIK